MPNSFGIPGPDFSNLFGNKGINVNFPDMRNRGRMTNPHDQFLQRQDMSQGMNQNSIQGMRQRNKMDVIYDPRLEMFNKELKEGGRQFDEGLEFDREKLGVEGDIAGKKQKLEEFKATNPEWEFKEGEGGYIYAINPMNPTQTIRTDVRSKELSEYEKNRLEIVKEREISAIKGEEERRNIGERGRQDRTTNAEKESTKPTTEETRESPLDQQRSSVVRAKRLISENPELTEFITFDGTNVIINEELDDPIERQRLSNIIFGSTQGDIRLPNESIGNRPTKIRVKHPDGRTGTIPSNQLEAAAAQGFVEVQ